MGESTPSTEWYEDPDALVAALASERRDRTGRPRIPGYDEFVEIGRGGQGVVFTARQLSTQRTVAVKILLGGSYASSSSHARFRREVDLVTRLGHPNIVHVYDSGVTDEGCPYLVMEYVDGVPLDRRIPNEVVDANGEYHRVTRVELEDSLKLFATICDAVQFAHQRGVIHRDLKPNNILIDDQGEPKILDFGVAAATGDDAKQLSVTGQFIGSLPWASPEQVADHGSPADVRSDVYALGVMLVQMLTGRFPYDVSTAVSRVVESILYVDPVRPSAVFAGLNDEIDTIAGTCLAKDPSRRYQSAGAVADDVRRYLSGEPLQAKRDSAWYQMRKLAGRYRAAVVFTAAALVLSIVFIVFLSMAYRDARSAERLAALRLAEVSEANAVARREADKAGAVNAFLEKMLASSDPTVFDRDVTVRETLEQATGRIDAEFGEFPGVEASLRNTIGWTHFNLGDFEKAAEQLSQSAELLSEHVGRETPEVLAVQHRLTQVYLALDRLTEADDLSRHVLETSRQVAGEDAWLTLSAMLSRAECQKSAGRLDDAKVMLEEMIALGEVSLGAEHPEVLVARNHMAIVQLDLGMFAEAEETYRWLIEIRAGRGERAAVATLKQNLASTMTKLGRYDEARALFVEAVDESSDVYGTEHPRTLSAKYNLASLLVSLEKYDEATSLTKQAAAGFSRLFGEGHKETLQARNQLAVIHLYQSKWAEAEVVLRETIDGYMQREGQRVPPVLYQNLAATLREQEKFDEALIMASKSLAMSDAQFGEESSYRVGILNELGRVRLAMGEASAAYEDFEDAHKVAEAVFPEGHPNIMIMKISMAKALLEMQDEESALDLLVDAYDGLVASLGAEFGETRKAAKYIAGIFERRGDIELQKVWLERAGID